MDREFAGTWQQMEIMSHVFAAAAKSAFISLPELKQKLSYGAEVSLSAVSCSVRILRDHGMVELGYGKLFAKERSGPQKCFIKPTAQAYFQLQPHTWKREE